jgi:hypothetical protein
MNIDSLRKEFPNLHLDDSDKDFLNYFKDKYKERAREYQLKNPKNNESTFKNYRDFFVAQADNNYISEPIFRKIADLCKNTPQHHDINFVYNRAHIAYIPGSLPYHVDHRHCVLSIPIGNLTHPVSWVSENKELIAQYHYTVPVLINTKVHHGCIENNEDRFLFQVGFHIPFEDVKNLLD